MSIPQHSGRKGADGDAASNTCEALPLWGAAGVQAGLDRSCGPRGFGRRGAGDRRLSYWRLSDRALAVKRGRIERLNIEELEVGRLHVRELIVDQEQTPRQGASAQPS